MLINFTNHPSPSECEHVFSDDFEHSMEILRKKSNRIYLALENSSKRRYNFIRFISSEEKLWIYEAKM